jgi:hypothetical protein
MNAIKMLLAMTALVLALAAAVPVTAASPGTISASRSGSTVTVTWTARDRFQYLWAAVTCDNGYDTWHQVKYEGWTQNPSVWTDVPSASCSATLWFPRMQGESRTWRALATTGF